MSVKRVPVQAKVWCSMCYIGPVFFIRNRLLVTGWLFSGRLNVEKERLGTRFRRRHAFHPMPAIWMVRLSPFRYRTKSFMLAQNRQSTNIHQQNQNSTSIRNIIYFIHTSLRYKKACGNWNRLSHMAGTRRKHRMWLVDSPPCSGVPQFTLFTLHFVTKRRVATETASVTWREHDVNIACDWLTPHLAPVFHSFWPVRNRACPG